LGGAAFRAVVDALRRAEGRCYVKLTGCYRISDDPTYGDLEPMVEALIHAAPDRLIWGSDFPHLSYGDRSTVALFNLLLRWAPDESLRRRVLVDTPAALYGW
jgi:predicted TIM-barrel fold metal-dependent hydrolase